VGPRTGLDDVDKRIILPLPGHELRPLGRPARSQSLYRLRYPGPYMYIWLHINALDRREASDCLALTVHWLHSHDLDCTEIYTAKYGLHITVWIESTVRLINILHVYS
jgi:hypothetical protein